MDAVKELREQFETVFDSYVRETPQVLADPGEFQQWAQQGPTLFDTAKALGIDTRRIVRTMSTDGTQKLPASRMRVGQRKRGQSGGGSGGTPTGEQILKLLEQRGPLNQSQLAEHFGTTRQTIAKRLHALTGDGLVIVEGDSPRQAWRARELAAA